MKIRRARDQTIAFVGLGRKGAASSLAAGAVVIDMSSSDPTATRTLGAELAERGIRMIDAPVSGRVEPSTTRPAGTAPPRTR